MLSYLGHTLTVINCKQYEWLRAGKHSWMAVRHNLQLSKVCCAAKNALSCIYVYTYRAVCATACFWVDALWYLYKRYHCVIHMLKSSVRLFRLYFMCVITLPRNKQQWLLNGVLPESAVSHQQQLFTYSGRWLVYRVVWEALTSLQSFYGKVWSYV